MSTLTLRQLEILVQVVDSGSFTACATHLGVSQAAVSDQIRSLEKLIGGTLFVRQPGKPVSMSATGQRVYERAKKILELASGILSESGDNPTQEKPLEVRVCAHSFIIAALQETTLAFETKHPNVKVRYDISLRDPVALKQRLSNGQTDIGFVYGMEGGSLPSGDQIGKQKLALFVRPGHPLLTSSSKIGREELEKYETIHLAAKSFLRELVADSLSRAEVKFRSAALETDEYPLILSATANSDCVTCIFEDEERKISRSHGLEKLDLSFEIPPLIVYRLLSDRALSNGTIARFSKAAERALSSC